MEELRSRFAAHGQGHVFAHWEGLDPLGRDRLLGQAARLEPQLADLSAAFRQALAAASGESPADAARIEPAEAIALPENGGDPERAEAARKRGEQLLADGRVGVFLVAGGQGTRLGFPHPKGCYPIGPVSDRSLFALHAQRLRGLARRFGRPVYFSRSSSRKADSAFA